VDDLQRLDRLRPWLTHAFGQRPTDNQIPEDEVPISAAVPTLLNGQLFLTAEAELVYQSAGIDFLLLILGGEPGNYTRHVPVRDRLPAPILMLLRQITGAANGVSNTPPRMQISTAYGVLTIEAKWLLPAGTLPGDAAKDPKSCFIAITIELREPAIAHAARVLRESGATPAQTKVGIQIALGKPKPVIADELGVQLSSVADHTKRLYETLDVHNSTELAAKIWLGQKQGEARQNLWRAGQTARLRLPANAAKISPVHASS
jgi:DNA-binding CsgD family transcriptional regulator